MPISRIRIPFSPQNFAGDGRELPFHDRPSATFSDMVFGFLEDSEEPLQASPSNEECRQTEALDEEDEDRSENGSAEEEKHFWEKQNQLLQVTT